MIAWVEKEALQMQWNCEREKDKQRPLNMDDSETEGWREDIWR